MIREDRFVVSRKPFAVDLGSLRQEEPRTIYDGSLSTTAYLDAVWFRRRRGVTVACIGHLWDNQAPPADAHAFLAAHDDGRYGGTCEGRWDGENYWGAQKPETIAAHLELLQPMLANYPELPAGNWSGWWRF